MQAIGLAGRIVTLAGGDARDIILAAKLRELGANVWLHGFQNCDGLDKEEVKQGLPDNTDVLILPLPGIDAEGYVYAPFSTGRLHINEAGHLFRPGLLVLCGRMPAGWQEKMAERMMQVVLTADLDELAILNAVPTAEGAVGVAMRESNVTISGSSALVTGFGRCGLPLARLLLGMNATVTVAARRREVLALAETMGCKTVTFEQLQSEAPKYDFVFNTVPSGVLHEGILSSLKKSVVIVDIASSPGGTDFAAAGRLGLKSFLALGLPGKVAPLTAGRILAQVYPYLISSQGKGGDSV